MKNLKLMDNRDTTRAEKFFKYKLKELNPFQDVDGLSIEFLDIDKAILIAEEYAQQYKIKADKWDKLNERIGKFYYEDNSEYSDEMRLVSIGEICANHLEYL